MPKITKTIFINIAILFLIAILFEIISLSMEYKDFVEHSIPEDVKGYKFLDYAKDIYQYSDHIDKDASIRQPVGLQYKNKKPSIVILGCSFAFGTGLSEDTHFGKILSDYSKRTVYNMGVSGGSPREALYILRNDKLLEEKIGDTHNVQYVFYVYISDHKKRLYANLPPNPPKFIKHNGGLIYKKNNILDHSIAVKKINQLLYYKYYINRSFPLLTLYFKEINKEIQNKFSYNNHPTKFIVLLYDQENFSEEEKKIFDWDGFNKEYCLKNNMEIISVKDLVGKEIFWQDGYILEDKNHPNTKAWELVSTKLTKKFHLR